MKGTALKPVYALVGSEPFLQLQKLTELLAQMPPDVQRMDFDGEQAELADVLDEVRSFAMFGGQRLVVVASADAFVSKFREPLETYAANPSSTGVLVLRMNSMPANWRLYKIISKTGLVEKCERPRDVKRWIIDRAKVHRASIAPDAASSLADLVGADLGRLDTELAKLALQSEGGKITRDTIGDTIAFQREQQMWDMTNALAAGRPAEALRRWRRLVQLDPSSEFRAVTWLTIWLEKVVAALALRREGTHAAAIARELKIWPQELQQPFFGTADRLGETGAARALDLLAELDRQSKTGVGEMADNVERFLLSIPQMMRPPAGRNDGFK